MSSGGMFGSKQGPEKKISAVSQLMTPQQQKYFTQALDLYGGQLGKNNVYQGQRIADFSPLQNKIFDFANQGGFVTSPEQTKEYFDTTIKNPAIKTYQDITAPAIKEAYSGPGYWGSARAGAEVQGAQDLRNQLNTDWGNLNWNVQQANKAGALQQFGLGQVQQAKEQAEINAEMQKFFEENQITDPTSMEILMRLLGMGVTKEAQGRTSVTTPSWHTGDWTRLGTQLGLSIFGGPTGGMIASSI